MTEQLRPHYFLDSNKDSPTSNWSIYEVVGTVIAVLIVGQLSWNVLERLLLAVAETLWNVFVYVMPFPFVYGLRSGFKSSTSILHGSENTSVEHAQKSEILRNALGIRTGQGAVARGSRRHERAPKGLGNFDNSCYQNSILQAVAAVPAVQSYLENVTARAQRLDGSSTVEVLQDLVSKLNDAEADCSYFWTPAKLKSMSSWQQQDAQEYFSKIVEAIEKDVKADAIKRQETDIPDLACLSVNNEGTMGLQEKHLDGTGEQKPVADGTGRETSDCRTPGGLTSPLEGLLAQRVGCTECGFCEGLSLIPFNCMTLPLGSSTKHSLEDCLTASTELEYIEGVECPSCTLLATEHHLSLILGRPEPSDEDGSSDAAVEPDGHQAQLRERLARVQKAIQYQDFSETTLRDRCSIPAKLRKSSTKTKQVALVREPKCLVMHVNRSMFDEYTGAQLKNHATVDFPASLDMSSWMVGEGCEAGEMIGDERAPNWSTNPKESMLPRGSDEKTVGRQNYALRAVVTHHGRHENGHYICYRQSPPRTERIADGVLKDSISTHGTDTGNDADTWWRISDEYMHPMSLNTVLAQPEAFMLFYEQIDKQEPDHDREDILAPNLVQADGNGDAETKSPDVAASSTDDFFNEQNADALQSGVSSPRKDESSLSTSAESSDFEAVTGEPRHELTSGQHQYSPSTMRTATLSQAEAQEQLAFSPHIVAPI